MLDDARIGIRDYREGILKILDAMTSQDTGVIKKVSDIHRVGFKTTLSKDHFSTHELTEDVIQGMKDWLPLAALHNAGYIEAIETIRGILPEAVFLGVFETGFHRDIPLYRRIYGVPYEWYDQYGVQRLGYHSASHGFIADTLNQLSDGKYRAISCHLGGSSSVCGILNGKSIDTSFGMTLQSGLIHAARTGDLDCDLFEFLRSQGLTDQEIHDGYEKKGGLLGISGISEDVRYISEAAAKGNERAQLALDAFVNGIVHYIGAFYIDLAGLDYLVFTAGIGENSALIREMVCEKLSVLGVVLDLQKNREKNAAGEIQGADSRVKIMVIPTNEELGIARRTYEYVRK